MSPAIGEQLTLNLNITAGEAVAGYQVTVQFDATALRYVESSNGDYLSTGAFFVPPVISGKRACHNTYSPGKPIIDGNQQLLKRRSNS